METKVHYTLVGLFVIALSAVLTAVLLWLLVGTEAKAYDSYVVHTAESVSGLNVNGPVKYRGVEVGRVRSMKIDPDQPEQVELILDIEHTIPLRQDTRAVLTSQGITGLLYVELTGGSRAAPAITIPADGSLPEIASGPSLTARLDVAFTTLAKKLGGLQESLDKVLSQENQAALSGTLSNLNTITKTVAGRSEQLGQAMDNAATTFEDSVRITGELSALLTRINTSVGAVEQTARAITAASKSIDLAAKESSADIKQLTQDTGPEMSSLLVELRKLTEIMQGVGEELERNPRALLFGRQPNEPGPGE